MRLAPKRSLHEAGWLALGACLIGGVAQPQAQHLNEERAAATNGGPAAVHVWLTTGDRTELLTHEPDLSFGAQLVAPLGLARMEKIHTPTLDIVVPLVAAKAAAKGLFTH